MPNKPLKNLLFIGSDASGCCWFRALLPGAELQKHDLFNVSLNLRPTFEDIEWADLIVFQRASSQEKGHFLEYLKFLGKPMVYDQDDYVFNTPPNNPFNKDKQLWTLPNVIAFTRSANLVTTTTAPLRDKLLEYNKNVAILPNSIMMPDKEPELPNNGDYVRLGWVGSSYHYDDVKEAIFAVKEILRKYPNVIFVAMGGIPDYVKEIIPASRMELHDYVPLEKYFTYLPTLKLDIGIAPLCYHPFNEAKSALRFLEYSVIKAVTVATDTWAFKEAIQDGENGFLIKKNKHMKWVSALETLVNDPVLRHRVAEKGYNTVKAKYNIATNYVQWASAYNSVLS